MKNSVKKAARKALFIVVSFAVVIAACARDDGPEKTVIAMLERAMIVSDEERFQAALADPESEAGKAYFTAKQELADLFVSASVEKRIRAELRAYEAKGWETLKTVVNDQGTFVVMFLRSDSQTAGEPVDKRPGWRKALFKVRCDQKEQVGCKIADLDRVVEKYGETPLFLKGEP